MPAALTAHLVRHAEHIHQGRVLVGRMPGVPLSESGRAQAERLADRLSAERINAVYASPSERAQATARSIAGTIGLPVETAPELDEIDFGEWTGATMAELDADPRWVVWNGQRNSARAPAGESMAEAGGRLTAFVEGLRGRHAGGACVLISHADVIRAGLCHVLGLSLDRYDRFDVDTASLSTLVAWEGGAKLVRLNETVPVESATINPSPPWGEVESQSDRVRGLRPLRRTGNPLTRSTAAALDSTSCRRGAGWAAATPGSQAVRP